jgi:predicted nuclease of predicted toxin-antitoxin system
MSVSGIGSSSLFSYLTENTQSKKQQLQQELQQLGQDLKSGNLSAAQTDFTTLQQSMPAASPATSTCETASFSTSQTSNPIAQAFTQLASDLQSGNLSAAQSDFSTLRQDLQSAGSQSVNGGEHHHHHHSGDTGSSQLSQLFSALGSALQSGDMTTAQQLYGSLQQDLGLSPGSSSTSSIAPSSGSTISINA